MLIKIKDILLEAVKSGIWYEEWNGTLAYTTIVLSYEKRHYIITCENGTKFGAKDYMKYFWLKKDKSE